MRYWIPMLLAALAFAAPAAANEELSIKDKAPICMTKAGFDELVRALKENDRETFGTLSKRGLCYQIKQGPHQVAIVEAGEGWVRVRVTYEDEAMLVYTFRRAIVSLVAF